LPRESAIGGRLPGILFERYCPAARERRTFERLCSQVKVTAVRSGGFVAASVPLPRWPKARRKTRLKVSLAGTVRRAVRNLFTSPERQRGTNVSFHSLHPAIHTGRDYILLVARCVRRLGIRPQRSLLNKVLDLRAHVAKNLNSTPRWLGHDAYTRPTAFVSLRVGPWDQLHACAPRPSARPNPCV
jgi:hypothetical protein